VALQGRKTSREESVGERILFASHGQFASAGCLKQIAPEKVSGEGLKPEEGWSFFFRERSFRCSSEYLESEP
jgi:hypothetical protein